MTFSKLILLLYIGLQAQITWSATVPIAVNVPNMIPMKETDNIQEESMPIPVPIIPQEQILPEDKPFQNIQGGNDAAENSQQAGSQDCSSPGHKCNNPTPNSSEQTKILDVMIAMHLAKNINAMDEIHNSETRRLTTAVTSESGSTLFGGASNLVSLLNNGGIIGSGVVSPILQPTDALTGSNVLGVIPTIQGNTLTLLSTVFNNLNTPANNLIASVGPTGIPVTSVTTGLGTGGILSNLLPSTLGGVTLSGGLLGLLSNLGLGGNVVLSGSNIALPTLSGGVPVAGITDVPATLVTNKPALINFLTTLANKLGVNLTPGTGLRFLQGRSDTEQNLNNPVPWLASVLVRGKKIADGVLVSDQHVLTIATPLVDILHGDVSVEIGDSNHCDNEAPGTKVSTISVMAHPDFNPHTKAHDLALIKLSNKITIDTKSSPICLPSLTAPYVLKEVTVPLRKTIEQCEPLNIRLLLLKREICSTFIDSTALLTGDKNCMKAQKEDAILCHETIGTPVQHIAKDGIVELLGLISDSMDCDQSENIRFVRIHDHLPWLIENLQEDNVCIRV